MADDRDLPGDDDFVASPPVVEVVLFDTGGPPRGALAMTIPAEAQAAQHHNRLRYGELCRLRLGIANSYAATRYR